MLFVDDADHMKGYKGRCKLVIVNREVIKKFRMLLWIEILKKLDIVIFFIIEFAGE